MRYNEILDGNNAVEERCVIKRSGERMPFDKHKIFVAISKANKAEGIISNRLKDSQIQEIADGIEQNVWNAGRDLSVEEIQDTVENALMDSGKHGVARLYIKYRANHAERRKMSDVDKKIVGILNRSNEEVKQENSNKNPTILSVQRDYMAGEWSRYWTRTYGLPEDVVRAHDEGILHFHDADYYAQSEHNCCLVNLGDMLQNGTCISGVRIDPPKSFATACTVASQIVAQVASSQYGGQTITLSHLAPFVDISRQKIKARLRKELAEAGVDLTEEKLDAITEREVRKEVEAGCQTIQYQLVTIMTTNGQAPFVTVFMYLNEVPEGRLRDDLAMVIEVMLEQRILGVKSRNGVYITPAFPKLIYVLQEDNIEPGTRYYDLTCLAAKCTAKRMVPDYISEKKMKELKKGDV